MSSSHGPAQFPQLRSIAPCISGEGGLSSNGWLKCGRLSILDQTLRRALKNKIANGHLISALQGLEKLPMVFVEASALYTRGTPRLVRPLAGHGHPPMYAEDRWFHLG